MNKLEEIFKNRFQNKASTEGIDADNLWAAIEGNLANDPKKGVFQRQQKWVLLLFICLFSGAFYFYKSIDNSNKEEALTQTGQTIAAVALKNEYSRINEVEKPNHTTTIERSKQKSIQLKKEQAKQMSLRSEKKNSRFKNNNNTGLLSLLQAREKAVKQHLSQAEGVPLSSQKPVTAYQPNHKTIKQQQQLQQASFFEEQHKALMLQQEGNTQSTPLPTVKYLRADKQTAVLPSLVPSVVMTTKSNAPEWPYYQVDELALPKRKSGKLPLELGLYTGVNTLNTRYEYTDDNRALSEELAKATSQNMGAFSSFRISYLPGDHYTINSGIDYEVTQNIFEKVILKDTVIADPNRLISYDIDPQTGDTINAVRGEVLLDAVETRTVLHYNRFKAISIPISFGVRKQFGQFGIGINVGVSYNFFISQKGKTLDSQGNIYAFDENGAAAAPFKKSFFAFQLNPYFDIAVSDHLRLRINPVFKYQMQGRSNLYNVGQNSILMGLSGGVVFSL